MRRLLSVTALLVSFACGGTDEAPPWEPSVTAIPTPASEGSGEPFLSTSGDAVHMSWLQEAEGSGHDLLLATLDEHGWSEPRLVVHRTDFFVNWADFPSVVTDETGRLWAHWLQRGEDGGYDYGIRLASSVDGGHTWSEPWTPHEDATATEHGFVSLLPIGGGVALTWLDGRKYAPGPDGSPATDEMTLRFRALDSSGIPGPEVLLDGRSCDCCQTDAAMASAGPVVVYRDRTQDEIRDIYITRWAEDGWTEGMAVHDDGWNIAGCPVNGPAVGARGDTVAVAWFTGAHDVPKVQVAYSVDGGATFAPPVRVDDGTPGGRVDLILQADGTALVSWQERTGGEGAEVRLRRVDPDGTISQSATVASTDSGRASGFPRMVMHRDGHLVVAWTDVVDETGQVRTARVELKP